MSQDTYMNLSCAFLGDLARLVSPTLRVTNSDGADNCKLRLHYHMYGENVKRLAVYTRTQDGGPLIQRMSKSGNKGSFWERVEVKLQPDVNVPFQVGANVLQLARVYLSYMVT